MNKKFPHLVDNTNFPGDDIKVFSQYTNGVNYDDIGDNTVFSLHNVNWGENDNYKVLWENETVRDKYFDDNALFSGTTESIVWPSEGRVKLPIDWFTSLNDYNYLTVVITHNNQSMRLFYFVQNFEYVTRDVTELAIALDYWTTYINKISIKQFNLARGHIATTWVTPENFLADPIANNKGLLSSDVMGDGDKTVKTRYVNMDSGRPYMLLALLANPADFNDVPEWVKTATYDSNFSGNTSQWAPARMAQSQDRPSASNYWIIGLPANQAEDLLWYWCQYYQPLLNSIRAAYVVGENMLNKGKQYGFGSITVYEILPSMNIELDDIKFTVNDFSYPAEYKGLAKLYTSPYASFEITGVNGVTQKFSIQGLTRNTKLVRTGNNIYPTLQVSTYLQGYNDTTSVNYDWVSITGNTTNVAHGGNSYAFMVNNYAIPTFELRMRADWNANLAQGNALHQAKIAADTALANVRASADAVTANTNTQNNAATTINGKSNDVSKNLVQINNDNLSGSTTLNNNYIENCYIQDKNLMEKTFDENIEAAAATTTNNNTASIQGAAIGVGATVLGAGIAVATAGTGAAVGAAIAGAGVSVAGTVGTTATNIQQANSSFSIFATKNKNLQDQQLTTASNKKDYAKNLNAFMTDKQVYLAKQINDAQVKLSEEINDVNVGASTDITANNVGTAIGNAARNNLVAQEAAHTAYHQARVSAPRALTQDGGDMQSAMDMTRGVTVNLNTLNSSDLKTVGDTFLTYGYQYDTTLINPILKCKPHFEYWQGEPIFTGAIPSTAREMITNVFMNGVTLYNTPEDIGHSIYDN